MSQSKVDNDRHEGVSRRRFVAFGGATAAASLALGTARAEEEPSPETTEPTEDKVNIRRYRTLGRTGFKASDISWGGIANDSSVIRYAYDRGITYFDTAESYGNGESERRIGEAMQHMDRSKIFITTKLAIEDTDTEQTLLDRFDKCQERLKTDYVDALYMHSVTDLKLLGHEGFHSAVSKLKAAERLRHCGISSHGPRGEEGDSMESVLVAAAEDGRFDLMLLVYNFLNKEAGEKVLAACKKHNVGTTAMKTAPARTLEVEQYDPENPAEGYADYIKRATEAGLEREAIDANIRGWVAEQEESLAQARPFIDKHGLDSDEALRIASAKWVLNNPDMHAVCIGMRDFDTVDTFVPLSGTGLDSQTASYLRDFAATFGSQYCRHACTDCATACPQRLPVSTIMRYSYYFVGQGREKYAMRKYAALGSSNGADCLLCDAPCRGACPHGANIRANLLAAHALLAWA